MASEFLFWLSDLDNIRDSVEGMAQFYITVQTFDKSFDKELLIKSFEYIESCSKEVAEFFFKKLNGFENTSQFNCFQRH